METIRLSHSTIKSLNTCPRLVLFEKEMRLFSEYGSAALKYGSAYHAGMDAYYSNGKDIVKAYEAAIANWNKPSPQIFNADYRNLENLLSSLTLYNEQFARDSEELVGTPEKKITTQILLTEEEKVIYGDISIDFVVVIDLLLRIDTMTWVVDHKTTAVDLPYMASKMRRMAQLMGYQFIAHDHFPGINGTFIFYHQLKATKSKVTGEYGKLKTDFMKFPQIYSREDYEQWRKYVIYNGFKLKKAIEAGYPPEFNSCYQFNRSCPYLPLCDYPKWDLERFLEMPGFVIVPDDREIEVAIDE